MNTDVTIIAAMTASILSFLSPCVLPLVPAYLIYLIGASLRRVANAATNQPLTAITVAAACLFVAGFSTVFVALGVGASAIGSLLRAYGPTISPGFWALSM
jgi:cytochrome c-type biogenesis protein